MPVEPLTRYDKYSALQNMLEKGSHKKLMPVQQIKTFNNIINANLYSI